MNKKLISSLVAGLALSAALPVQAAPLVLQAGAISIYFDQLLDQGTTGYSGSGTVCSNIAACNAIAQNTAPTMFGDDSWGVLSASQIVSNEPGGGVLWARDSNATATSALTGMFYGLQDYRVDINGAITTTYSTGGQVDLYWNTTNWLLSSVSAASRTAVNAFTGITGGTLALSALFTPTASTGDLSSTYSADFNTGNLAGSGSGYADVVSGTGNLATLLEFADLWNDGDPFTLDPHQDQTGVFHDIYLSTLFNRASTAQLANKWSVVGTARSDSFIPEPGSMALTGLGLMGLAALRRRKQQA